MRANVSHDTVAFRHAFLRGLRDAALASQAEVEALPIGVVIQRAGRIEQRQEVGKGAGWQEGPLQQVMVASITTRKDEVRQPGFNRKRRAFEGGSDRKPEKFSKCGKCGRKRHEKGQECPATGKQCFKCGRMNHFTAVCTSEAKVNAIETGRKEESSSKENGDTKVEI